MIGRADADIKFSDDVYMSPLHARLELREGALWLRDLGSRNGSWVFIDGPTKLTDGDLILVGSQVLRFRRLGYPGPHPPEADSTRRMGSLTPSADVAVVEQLRADASVRDTNFHSVSWLVCVMLGRETGDWIFPYDQTAEAAATPKCVPKEHRVFRSRCRRPAWRGHERAWRAYPFKKASECSWATKSCAWRVCERSQNLPAVRHRIRTRPALLSQGRIHAQDPGGANDPRGFDHRRPLPWRAA